MISPGWLVRGFSELTAASRNRQVKEMPSIDLARTWHLRHKIPYRNLGRTIGRFASPWAALRKTPPILENGLAVPSNHARADDNPT
jgi:hypothetical protein